MSNLDNIKEQIHLEAKKAIDALEGETLATLDRERHEAMQQANREAQNLLERARLDVPLIEERVQAEADRDARNTTLRHKQDVVAQVMRCAQDKLAGLPAETVLETLEAYLTRYPLSDGDVIEVPCDVTVHTETGTVRQDAELVRGFRILRDGVRENYDFFEVLDDLKDDVEQEVMKALAEGEA